MSKRIDQALAYHKQGYNCSQAVACAYCDLVGLDQETMFKVAEGFGAGMGGMEATCGAVSGAVIVAGLKNSSGDLSKKKTKAVTYKLSKQIVDEFQKLNQSVICKELKGIETNKVLRSCHGCVNDAAMLLEQILFKDQNL